MDMTLLMVSMLFGMIGLGMFNYGRKAGRMVPLGAGALLMAVPYFLPNVMLMVAVCSALVVSPWVIREG